MSTPAFGESHREGVDTRGRWAISRLRCARSLERIIRKAYCLLHPAVRYTYYDGMRLLASCIVVCEPWHCRRRCMTQCQQPETPRLLLGGVSDAGGQASSLGFTWLAIGTRKLGFCKPAESWASTIMQDHYRFVALWTVCVQPVPGVAGASRDFNSLSCRT